MHSRSFRHIFSPRAAFLALTLLGASSGQLLDAKEAKERDITSEEIAFYRFITLPPDQQSKVLKDYNRYKQAPLEFAQLKNQANLYEGYQAFLKGHYEDQPLAKLEQLRKERETLVKKIDDTSGKLNLSTREVTQLKQAIRAKDGEISSQQSLIEAMNDNINEQEQSLLGKRNDIAKVAKTLGLKEDDIKTYLLEGGDALLAGRLSSRSGFR